MDKVDTATNAAPRPLSAAEEAHARAEAAEGADLPAEARDWLGREEAAQALGKSVRTVDRMLRGGHLVRIGEDLPIRVSRESVERVRGEHLPAKSPTVIVQQAAYEALLLHKERLEGQLRDRDQRLLSWEGTVQELQAARDELTGQLGQMSQERDAERQAREAALAALEKERQARAAALEQAKAAREAAQTAQEALEQERSLSIWARIWRRR